MLFVVCQWHVSVNAGQNEVANRERGICVGDKTLWLRSRYIKKKRLYLFYRACDYATILCDRQAYVKRIETMKRSILVLLALWGILGIHTSVRAQNLVIGSRVSELKTSEYLHGTLQKDRPMLIEFFYSASEPCRDRLPELNKLAGDYAGKIDVLVLANEDRDRIIPLLKGENYAFAVALDDAGKTFNAYGVRFVPFSVLLDAKGPVLWFGHSARLTIPDLEQAL